MHRRSWIRQLVGGVALLAMLSGCATGSGASPTPQPSPTQQPSPTATASPTLEPSQSASPMPSAIAPTPSAAAVTKTSDITYGATGTVTGAEQLDVYAPTRPGPWPVVVMFHGYGVTKADYAQQAVAVADEGFVVFVANWGRLAAGSSGMPTPEQFEAWMSEGACAVAYARSHATEYGGNADNLIIFGHSAGANLVGAIAFSRPSPPPGCPGGESLGTVSALVTWDGDWDLMDPSWDGALSADPSRWEGLTAYWDVSGDPELKVEVLASGDIGPYIRNLSDPAAADAFFSVRGPSGFLRGQVEALGAFDDKVYDIKEAQQLFYSQLEAQGNPVIFTTLPGTSHTSFGMKTEALSVFVATFVAAAGD